MTDGADPTAPLWRAAQVFRLLSCGYALGFQVAVNQDLSHPAAAWSLFAVLMVWSTVCAVAYLRGFGRRGTWVTAELVVAVLLMLSTDVVASRQWALDNQSWPTTLWASNATISSAIHFGPAAGMLTGALLIVTSAVIKGFNTFMNLNLGHNATVIVELAVGLAVGMARQTAGAPTTSCNMRPGCRRRWRSVSGCPGTCTTE